MEFNNRLLLKIIELVFICTIVILVEITTDRTYTSQAMLVCGTLTGYLLNTSILLIGHCLGAPIDKRLDALLSVAACILFLASGGVIVDQWSDELNFGADKTSLIGAGTMGISIACIVLILTGISFHHPLIICGTVGGYTVICAVILIGHIINSVIEKRLNALFAIIGCVLFVVAGALIVDEWHDSQDLIFKERKRNALATGSLMIINGAVFLLDTLSICRSRQFIPIIRETSNRKVEITPVV